MKVPRTLIPVIGAILVFAACSSELGGNPVFGSQPTGDQSQGAPTLDVAGGPGDESDALTQDTTDPDADGGGLEDLGVVASKPLPMQEGLGTFDNYEWHMEMSTIGPTAEESSSTTIDQAFNRDPKSRYALTSTLETGPDFPEPETAITEMYQVGGETCQWDGESWSYTAATDQQREVLEVTQRLFDITIVPDNPIEVGKESVAGIPATHWQFAVSGFGSESGALVTANQMDYWVADDTGVLLRYEMVVESRSGPTTDPTAEVYRLQASAILLSANTPVPITLSPDCLATADTE